MLCSVTAGGGEPQSSPAVSALDRAILGLPDDHGRGAALVAAVADVEQRHLLAADLDGLVVVEDVVAGELLAVEGKHLVEIFRLGDRQRAALERNRFAAGVCPAVAMPVAAARSSEAAKTATIRFMANSSDEITAAGIRDGGPQRR